MRLCVLLLLVVYVSGNSVHFTNSENHLAKSKYEEFTSYHLDVPGSTDSITIIESKNKDESARDMEVGESKRQIVYAPTLLSKYIDEYNRKKNNDFGEDSRSTDSRSSEEEYRSYGRPQLPSQPQKSPYRESEGWVTLEAVPWSKSKVSIWKAGSKPNGDHSLESLENESIPSYGLSAHFSQKQPQKGYLPPKSHTYLSRYPDKVVKEKEGIITAPPIDRFYEYGSNDRSDSAYSHSLGYPGDIMNKEFQSQPVKHRPPAVGNYRDHHLPSSYPENGNGEWVLVSTTKGYQKNRSSPKKLSLENSQKENTQKSPTNYRMHKALKLTVLPPKDKSMKMVLSHNGLIEVAESVNPISSDQNIEAAVLSASKNKKKKRQTVKQEMKIVKAVPVNVNHSAYDKSTVLAAVTAGMVPASMAMMVPLLGKK
ncbi:hypothetical protein ACFFRR_002601 [Megaselia abdita]